MNNEKTRKEATKQDLEQLKSKPLRADIAASLDKKLKGIDKPIKK